MFEAPMWGAILNDLGNSPIPGSTVPPRAALLRTTLASASDVWVVYLHPIIGLSDKLDGVLPHDIRRPTDASRFRVHPLCFECLSNRITTKSTVFTGKSVVQ